MYIRMQRKKCEVQRKKEFSISLSYISFILWRKEWKEEKLMNMLLMIY